MTGAVSDWSAVFFVVCPHHTLAVGKLYFVIIFVAPLTIVWPFCATLLLLSLFRASLCEVRKSRNLTL